MKEKYSQREILTPEWPQHDNPHHAGQHSHLRRIAESERELFEFTGVKGKQAKNLRVSELMRGLEPLT